MLRKAAKALHQNKEFTAEQSHNYHMSVTEREVVWSPVVSLSTPIVSLSTFNIVTFNFDSFAFNFNSVNFNEIQLFLQRFSMGASM